MKKLQITIGLGISLLILSLMITMFTPTVKADTYSSTFDPNREYMYNVSKWDQELNWYYTSDKGWVNCSAGGQIKVDFTGFYNFSSPLWDPNVFENPVPFINISFYEKIGDMLSLNRTMINQSSAEAANVMALGYRQFDAGFLIPTDDFNRLNERILAQNINETYVNYQGTHKMEEFQKIIMIAFRQNTGGQNTTLIYDKGTGILVWANVQSAFGPDFEFQLNDYVLDFTPIGDNIPAFPILIVFTVSGLTIIVSIFIKRKKFTLK